MIHTIACAIEKRFQYIMKALWKGFDNFFKVVKSYIYGVVVLSDCFKSLRGANAKSTLTI